MTSPRRETWVKIGYVAFLLVAAGYGCLRFYVKLHEASVDDGIHNSLRNLHAIAQEHAKTHGNPSTVQIADLDRAALYNGGIRPPFNGVYPTTITLGQPLAVTGVDGKRSVIFDPRN